MRGRGYDDEEWESEPATGYGRDYRAGMDDEGYGSDEGGYGEAAQYEDDERGLVLQQEESLVGVSSIVTQHGTPILSFTRTMNRFYTSRKQRLSLGRHRCEVCGDRIRFWSYETPTGNHTHDACYERLAWTWTNLYAQQQRMASEGRLD
jgi:hypothetical protein